VHRLAHVSVARVFAVPGGLFYGVITKAPATLIIRDARGRRIFTKPVLAAPPGPCITSR